jgi:uncharacterized membrane protein YciS (DUF1049 family)
MNAKMFLRGFVFLLLCFVVLYVGMNNTHKIAFSFPVLLDGKISQPAALLFFAMFAIGVIAGMVLNAGGGGGGGDGPKKK